MAESNKSKDRIDPFNVFFNALGFENASGVIDAQGAVPMLLWPKVACSAFALELFLKCVLCLRGSIPHGHNVSELFRQLSDKDRRKIQNIFDEAIKEHPHHADFVGAEISLDIESVLTRASDMFIRSRYWHELNLPAFDATGVSSNAGICRLCGSVKILILEEHPEYLEQAKQFDFPFAGVPFPPFDEQPRA